MLYGSSGAREVAPYLRADSLIESNGDERSLGRRREAGVGRHAGDGSSRAGVGVGRGGGYTRQVVGGRVLGAAVASISCLRRALKADKWRIVSRFIINLFSLYSLHEYSSSFFLSCSCGKSFLRPRPRELSFGSDEIRNEQKGIPSWRPPSPGVPAQICARTTTRDYKRTHNHRQTHAQTHTQIFINLCVCVCAQS